MSRPKLPLPVVLLTSVVVLLFHACGVEQEEQDYVARVHDSYLLRSELAEYIPATLGKEDSLKRSKVFINNWVKDQVVLNKAAFNVSVDDERFQRKLEAYLNDLMIYEYEQSLVDQELDTVVTENQLRTFYEENTSNFVLKEDVFRVRALVLPEHLDGVEAIVNKFQDYDEVDSLDVWTYAAQHELLLRDEPNTWMDLEELLSLVPIKEEYLLKKVQQKDFFDKSEDGLRYLLHVHEYRLKESEAPFEMEAQRIRSILLNSRKKSLLEDMRNQLFQDALDKGQIEIRS